MLKVRKLTPLDINYLRKIHDKYFAHEFDFDHLFGHSLGSFVVVDEDDKILVGGQVQAIAEVSIVTDKDYDVEWRRQALLEFLKIAKMTTKTAHMTQLHAFVQDQNWMRHLKKYGFTETKGQALVTNV